MSVILVKNKNEKRMQIIEAASFEKDNREDDLHMIVEEQPILITSELESSEVIVVGSKVSLPSGKEVDLILCDSRGNIILVELKRGRTPREAIAQLLDYAASVSKLSVSEFLNVVAKDLPELMNKFESVEFEDRPNFEENLQKSLKSPRLLLVSYEIPEDILRVSDFLRSKNIMINCVEFDYYKKDALELFVPEVIGHEETIEIQSKELGVKEKHYQVFFEGIIERFKQLKPGLTRSRTSRASYIHFSSGYPKIHFEWHLGGRDPKKELYVALDFELDDYNDNIKLLEHFKKKKSAYESKLGEKIYFNEKFGEIWTRIYLKKEVGSLEHVKDNPKIREWAVQSMIRFYETLKPELDIFVTEVGLK